MTLLETQLLICVWQGTESPLWAWPMHQPSQLPPLHEKAAAGRGASQGSRPLPELLVRLGPLKVLGVGRERAGGGMLSQTIVLVKFRRETD